MIFAILKGGEKTMKPMPQPEVLISARQIQRRVKAMAGQINRFYADKVNPENPLLVVVVMKGAMYFAVDLTRYLTIPFVIRTERVESGWTGSRRSGKKPVIYDPLSADLAGQHVLVVEDLIDSGEVMNAIDAHYGQLKPASLNVVTVVIKRGAQTNGQILKRVRWCGFPAVSKDHWLVGYGMDHRGQLRHLGYIGFYPGNKMP